VGIAEFDDLIEEHLVLPISLNETHAFFSFDPFNAIIPGAVIVRLENTECSPKLIGLTCGPSILGIVPYAKLFAPEEKLSDAGYLLAYFVAYLRLWAILVNPLFWVIGAVVLATFSVAYFICYWKKVRKIYAIHVDTIALSI
jgi:hypothetical protein